jgi:hypothetical protein
MKIYLFKLRPINLYNLPLGLFHLNANTSVYDPCTFNINDQGLIELIPGNFVKHFTNNQPKNFRHLDWHPLLPKLVLSIEQAKKKNQIITIGTYQPDQLSCLKNTFQSDLISIGVDYDESSYPILLKNLSTQHLFSLRNNLIVGSDHDQELLKSKSTTELIDYYISAFDQLNLIPTSDSNDCDYHINLHDLFDKSAMTSHFINLKYPFTKNSELFYDRWLRAN